jgi:hypothetical protein
MSTLHDPAISPQPSADSGLSPEYELFERGQPPDPAALRAES